MPRERGFRAPQFSGGVRRRERQRVLSTLRDGVRPQQVVVPLAQARLAGAMLMFLYTCMALAGDLTAEIFAERRTSRWTWARRGSGSWSEGVAGSRRGQGKVGRTGEHGEAAAKGVRGRVETGEPSFSHAMGGGRPSASAQPWSMARCRRCASFSGGSVLRSLLPPSQGWGHSWCRARSYLVAHSGASRGEARCGTERRTHLASWRNAG